MTVRAADQSLIESLFRAIDAKATADFLACIAPDATFRFGAAQAVEGREAIRSAVEGFFQSVAGLAHRLDRRMSDGDTLICEGEVTYTRLDGSTITLPFANILDLADGLIKRYRIYIDIAPLYNPG